MPAPASLSLPGGCADWCGGAGSENDVPWLNL